MSYRNDLHSQALRKPAEALCRWRTRTRHQSGPRSCLRDLREPLSFRSAQVHHTLYDVLSGRLRHMLALALLVFLPGCIFPPSVTSGLAVLDVDSGALRSFPINGTIIGADERSQRLYMLEHELVYQYSGTTNPSSKTALVPLVPIPQKTVEGLCLLSPDFGKVAFFGLEYVYDTENARRPQEGIWIMPVAGENKAKRVLDVENDCDYLAWVSETDIVCGINSSPGNNKYSGCILRINTETAEPKVLFRGNIRLSSFALSPDRRQLAFFEKSDTSWALTLKVVDVESSVVTEPFALPDLAFNQLAWSPDGSRLALGDLTGLCILRLADKSVVRADKEGNPFCRLYFVTDDRVVALRTSEGRGSWLYTFNAKDGSFMHYVPINFPYTAIALPKQRALVIDTGCMTVQNVPSLATGADAQGD